MKKHLLLFIFLIFTALQLSAQKSKDVLYLKNGSIVYGKLVEIKDDQYKMQTADGSLFIYKNEEVDRFAKESPYFEGRSVNGFSFSMEAGLLVGAQNTEYTAPFSFNFLGGVTIDTRNVLSLGSGVEFIGVSFTPLYLEYKRLIYNRKTTPFIFIRGGGVIHVGGNDEEPVGNYNNYEQFNYEGGASFTLGTGISWAKPDYETYLSFAYRYANTSYQKREYNMGNITYENNLNRLEIKFGFRF